MKHILIVIIVFATIVVNGQSKKSNFNFNVDTTNGRWYSSKDFQPVSKNIDDSKPISFVTSKRDTLYLVNEGIGLATAKLWEGNNYKPERDGKKPKIVFVTQHYIIARHENKVLQKFIVNE